MKKCLAFIWLSCLLWCCKSKKSSTPDSVEVKDFLAHFKAVKLPYLISDTVLNRGNSESNQIARSEFVQFIPDSLIESKFGKNSKPRFYAGARIAVKKAETYLFVKAVSYSRRVLYVLVFDKDDHFVTGMAVINQEPGAGFSYQVGMDNKYTLSVTRLHKSEEGQQYYSRDAYVYNDEGVFTLILTESNQSQAKNLQIINPIDTLPHKHKFTGDYIQDKRNFISVRDSKDPAKLLIFIHFEKDNGDCKGELKGDIRFINANTARYRGNSDPCSIELVFSPVSVRMKELQACGNHRDIKCFFEGVYERKKSASPKPQGKRPKNKQISV